MESTNLPAVHLGNTLENGKQGHYDFSIKEILSEAWQKTYGIKATYWKAILFALLAIAGFFLVAFFIAFVSGFLTALTHASETTVKSVTIVISSIFQIIFIFFSAPLGAGISMIGVKHITGQAVNAKSIFNYYHYWKRLWVAPFIISVINLLAEITNHIHPLIALLISLLCIAFAVTYFMFSLLIVEKKLTVWPALESSRKAISHHWFKTLWLIILFLLILIGSLLTLGILAVWTMPMINNSVAILYRDMFGVNEDQAVKNVSLQT